MGTGVAVEISGWTDELRTHGSPCGQALCSLILSHAPWYSFICVWSGHWKYRNPLKKWLLSRSSILKWITRRTTVNVCQSWTLDIKGLLLKYSVLRMTPSESEMMCIWIANAICICICLYIIYGCISMYICIYNLSNSINQEFIYICRLCKAI